MKRKSNAREACSGERRWIGGLFLLVLLMFGDLLFAKGVRVVGGPGTDLFSQFVAWRELGFAELAKGNLALWNPHIYGGAPYFGGMQAALLYPPNWLFLILPLAAAINWSIALHVWMLGAFMFFWMRQRGLHPAAGFFGGAVVMFSGAHFLHVYAGHLPNLCAMVWAPLVFLAIDRFFEKRTVGACLLGMFAVAMQIFAGHPQYVFYTAIAAGIYALLRLGRSYSTSQRETRLAVSAKAALGLLTIYPGGAALAAVQLLTGAQATAETIRHERLPFEFAKMFAFPPENLLTLVAPNFFGDPSSYWGRCYLWEMSLFIGVTACALAIYAVVYEERKSTWLLAAMAAITFMLALGVHTPLFAWLYHVVPGFDKFRGISKFIFPTTLFLTALAATGGDRLIKQRAVEKSVVWAVLGMGGLFGLVGFVVILRSDWTGVVAAVQATSESYLPRQVAQSFSFAARAQSGAAWSLLLAAGACAILGGLLAWSRRDRRAVWGVMALGVIETFVFARTSRPAFDMATVVVPELKEFLAAHPGDYRIINPFNPNSALLLRAQDLWGNDPGVVRRYAEFIAWTQGLDPDAATQYVSFPRLDPLYALLRLRYALVPQPGGMRLLEAPTPPLPRVLLISKYRVAAGRDAVFALLRGREFDPRREVILEREPDPKPSGIEPAGTAKVISETTDSLTVEADLAQPAILLITDVYTPAWRATALPGSVQASYELGPGDYTLRAVPLAAGHHSLRVEYAPRAFVVGAWISIGSILVWCAGVVRVWRQNRR